MRAAASGVWEMLDDALTRPHDIHAVDPGRSAVGHVVWSGPPMEDIFPLVDRLLAAGAGKQELTRHWLMPCGCAAVARRLVKRGADFHSLQQSAQITEQRAQDLGEQRVAILMWEVDQCKHLSPRGLAQAVDWRCQTFQMKPYPKSRSHINHVFVSRTPPDELSHLYRYGHLVH